MTTAEDLDAAIITEWSAHGSGGYQGTQVWAFGRKTPMPLDPDDALATLRGMGFVVSLVSVDGQSWAVKVDSPAEPIPMRLPCPECGVLHIDEGEFATRVHHTHSCQSCGLTWRPAVVPTVGVRFLPGFKNEPAEPTCCDCGHALSSHPAQGGHGRLDCSVCVAEGCDCDGFKEHPR